MGPMAPDFHPAFGLGESPKAISTVDADGVALAAIQGLHQMLIEKDRQLETLRAEVAAQRAETTALKQRMSQIETVADQLLTQRTVASPLPALSERPEAQARAD